MLGLSRWNENWNVRNSNSYVATANHDSVSLSVSKITRCRIWRPIGWLFNWKCKLSCRIISNLANYLKFNFLRLWRHRKCHVATLKISQICSQDTLLASRVMISCSTFYLYHIFDYLTNFWSPYLSYGDPHWSISIIRIMDLRKSNYGDPYISSIYGDA